MRATLTAATTLLIAATAGFAQDAGKSAVPKTNAVVPPASTADQKSAMTNDVNALAIADVRDWRGLAKRLEVMGEADLLPTAAIWKPMPAETKAAVKRVARATTTDAADQRVLLDALNGWIVAKNSAADASMKADNVRDAEIQSLLKLSKPEAADTRRLHRLLVDSMFPFELKQQAPVFVADKSEKTISAYPPNRPAEVTLQLSVPRLKGRLNVFLPNEETLVFRGEKPLELKVPNTGSLRYAFSGDGYESPYSRTITWSDDDVKNGVVAKSLSIFGKRTGE